MEKPLKKKWLVLLNPHAGSGRGKKDRALILKMLDQAGFEYELKVSEFPKHAIRITIEAIVQGFRSLMIVGGDGTLNEAVNGIFTQTTCPPENIIIGMIPVGTGNDWIKTFGVSNNYQAAIQIIKNGQTMRQDVGRISFHENNLVRTSYFANMAGFGFDAMVTERTNRLKNKGKKGISLYLQALCSSFWNFHSAKTHLVIDGQEIDELIFSVSIGIGKYNGGGMMQAPGAVPDNGQFQVTVIRDIGFFGILRNLAGLYSGEFVKDPRVSTYQGSKILIDSSLNISGEADGEILGNNKFAIVLFSQKLTVIFNPEKYLKFG